MLVVQTDGAVDEIARPAGGEGSFQQAVEDFVNRGGVILSRVRRQAGGGGIRLGFVVVVMVVERLAEFRMVINVKIEAVIVQLFKGGEGFAASLTCPRLYPAGDAKRRFAEKMAILVRKQDAECLACCNGRNGVAAFRLAGQGQGGGSAGFAVNPAVILVGDVVGKKRGGAGDG